MDRAFAPEPLKFALTRPEWTVLVGAIDEKRLATSLGNALANTALLQGLFTCSAAEAVRRSDRPVVNVVDSAFVAGIPTVAPDNHAAGRLAFEHLCERGLRHFAYLPRPAGADNRLRQTGFLAAADDHGLLSSTTVLPNAIGKGQWLDDIRNQAGIF